VVQFETAAHPGKCQYERGVYFPPVNLLA
jgi:hypothetical protein